MRKKILHLCADTGSDSKPYQDSDEYEVIMVGKSIGVENFKAPKNVYGVIANPVCTEFSVAREGYKFGTKEKQSIDIEKGLFLVRECQRIIKEADPVFWVIENPATGKLKQFLGEPTYKYEPWWYGSPWTKRTALWGKFNIPERKYLDWENVPKIDGLYTRPNRQKPSLAFMHKSHKKFIREFDCFGEVEDDTEFRSLCSQNFAKAFYEVNK